MSSVGTPNPSTLMRLAETAARREPRSSAAIQDGVLGVAPSRSTARA